MAERSIHRPIAWWKLDDLEGGTICKDWSGNNYHGLYINSPSLNQTGAFGISKAVKFASASSQKVTATPTVAAYPFTMSLWVKPTDLAAQTELMEIKTTLGHVRIEQRADASLRIIRYDGTTNDFTLVKSSVFTAGTWTHITLVCESSTSAVAYVNGGSPVSVSVSVDFTGATGVTLAAYVGGSYFNGTIDDARIYDFALEPSEVLELYNFSDVPYGEIDIFTNNIYDRRIPETVGIVTSPDNGVYKINDIGNKNLTQAQNILTKTGGQSFNVYNL